MSTFEQIWVLDGTLQTQHGAALAPTLDIAFPLGLDPEHEGSVVLHGESARIHWRTSASMSWDSLVSAIRTAAPDAMGSLTVQFPYGDDPTPTFLVFRPDGVSAHRGYWAMSLQPFQQWPDTPIPESTNQSQPGEPLDCPVCATPKGLEKRVNDAFDEIWVCTTCPAVLFTFHDAPQLDRVADVLGIGRS